VQSWDDKFSKNMLRVNYDIIIVGGGPAGAMAGWQLARQGRAVLLLEKADIHRAKPCGGGLTYRTCARFPELAALLPPHILNTVSAIRFFAPDLSSLHYTYPEPLTLMIQRTAFDALLLNSCRQAGVTVLLHTPVTQVTHTAYGVEVITAQGQTFQAQVVIGADGVQSRVATQTCLRAKWPREHLMVSVVAEIPVVPEQFDQNTIQILFGISGFGYGWVFPKQRYLNLGIANLLPANRQTRLLKVYDQFLQTLVAQGLFTRTDAMQQVKGGLLPMHGVMPHTQTDRVLLCGDAAGFVHAVTGEGIYYALVSGACAAQAVLHAFQQNDFSAQTLRRYQDLWETEIGQELADAVHVQQRLLQYPTMLNRIVRTAARHAGLKRLFTDYFMGKVSYRQVKHDLFWRFLPAYVRLYWRDLLRRGARQEKSLTRLSFFRDRPGHAVAAIPVWFSRVPGFA
jgi:geranylgeranyl reductase family protein